jgi:hypothetical protein
MDSDAAMVPGAPDDLNRAVARVVEAFVLRDYRKCVIEGDAIFPKATLPHLLVMIASYHRLDSAEGLADIRTRLERIREAHPWMHAVLAMQLGELAPAAVRERARSGEERAQYHGALGTRLLGEGRVQEARREFQACVDSDGDQMMSVIAKAQMEWGSQKPLPDDLRRALYADLELSKRASDEGRLQEALEMSTNSLALLDRYDGPDAPWRLMIVRNIMLLGLQLGKRDAVRNGAQALLRCYANLCAGDAREEALYVADTLWSLFLEHKEYQAAKQILLYAAALRTRYRDEATNIDLFRTIVRIAMVCAEAGDQEAAWHFSNAVGFAEDNLSSEELSSEGLHTLLELAPAVEGAIAEVPALCRLIANHAASIRDDQRDIKTLLCTAVVALWNRVGDGDREVLLNAFLSHVVGHGAAPSPEARQSLVYSLRRHARPSSLQEVHALFSVFDAAAARLELHKKWFGIWRRLLGVSTRQDPGARAMIEDLNAELKALTDNKGDPQLNETVDAMVSLARELEHLNEAHTALALVEALTSYLPPNVDVRTKARIELERGSCLTALGNFPSAIGVLSTALKLAEAMAPQDHALLGQLETALAAASVRYADGSMLYWSERAYESAKKAHPEDDFDNLLRSLTNLTKARLREGQFDIAAEEISACLASIDKQKADADSLDALLLEQANIAVSRGAYEEAVSAYESSSQSGGGARRFNAKTLAMHAYCGVGRWTDALEAALYCLASVQQRTLQGIRALTDEERFMLYHEYTATQDVVLSVLASADSVPDHLLARAWHLTQTRNTLSLDCMLAERQIGGDSIVRACVEELRRTESAIASIQLTGSSRYISKARPSPAVLAAVQRLGGELGPFGKEKTRSVQLMNNVPRGVGVEDERAFEVLRIMKRRQRELQRAIRGSAAFADAMDLIAAQTAP